MDSPCVLCPGIGLASVRHLCLVKVVKHLKSSGMFRFAQNSAKIPRSFLNVETFAANVMVVELVSFQCVDAVRYTLVTSPPSFTNGLGERSIYLSGWSYKVT